MIRPVLAAARRAALLLARKARALAGRAGSRLQSIFSSRLRAALREAREAFLPYQGRVVGADVLAAALEPIRRRHQLTSLRPVPGRKHWRVEGQINPQASTATGVLTSYPEHTRFQMERKKGSTLERHLEDGPVTIVLEKLEHVTLGELIRPVKVSGYVVSTKTAGRKGAPSRSPAFV